MHIMLHYIIPIQKSPSDEDATESEVLNEYFEENRKNETKSSENEKYNANSEDAASLETIKKKRKYVSSNDDSGEGKSERWKAINENTKPKPQSDEKDIEKFESIVQDTLTMSAALRKFWTKKETTWKKKCFDTDLTKSNEIVDHFREEFTKFFSDIKIRINMIEKFYTHKFDVLENELMKTKEINESTSIKVGIRDDDVSDVDDKPATDDEYQKTIDNSPAINVSSIVQNIAVPKKEPRNNDHVILGNVDDADEVTMTEMKDSDESVLTKNKAKLTFLPSPDYDNQITDDEELERFFWKKRKHRHSSDSDENGTEDSSEKKNTSLSKKKKTENASFVNNFDEDNGDDSDASNFSFSRLSSLLKNENKASLNNEDLSDKISLYSSDDEQNDDDVIAITSDYEKSMSSENPFSKSDEKKILESISMKFGLKDFSSEGFQETGKLPKPDTKDKNGIIQEDEELGRNGNSSHSEDVRELRKLPAKSIFEINNISDSDDSIQIISDTEMTPPPKSEKKRREIENFRNSDNLEENDVNHEKTPGLTNKGDENSEMSDVNDSDDSVQIIFDEEITALSPKCKKKSRKIKKIEISNDSKSTDGDEKTPGTAIKGRKNIRKMLEEDDLGEITKRTAKEEVERKKRILERQAIYNESFKIDEDINKAPDRLILDFDPETKKEIVVVHDDLVKKLKPHQAKGIKFMWDSCFESVKMTETSPGGGCILAHCMGLGKTLQVITLIHTVMRYPELKMNKVLILCPLNTVLNWVAEFEFWLQDVSDGGDINICHLNKTNNLVTRTNSLNNWYKNGGVMIMGYGMFRSLVNLDEGKKKKKEYFNESLLDPGPDLVVCDEGHVLKNEQSAISQATMKIRTKRRIVLTGTPLQNNLIEYHCMVQFVKQNLLGNRKEFLNRFANPITNGQYSDSTSRDVRVMKRRAHVLHKMLEGVVQRFDYNVLTPFLPSKHEFVILVSLSDLQAKLYKHYIDTYSKKVEPSNLFKDYQIMRLIWTHPFAMKLSDDRRNLKDVQEMENDEVYPEGSSRDFVIHTDEQSENTRDSYLDGTGVSIRTDGNVESNSKTKADQSNGGKNKELGKIDEESVSLENGTLMKGDKNVWWRSMVTKEEINDYRMGPKLILLFAIIQQCENIGDKVLVFSQSLPSLDMIEYFLGKWEEIQQNDKSEKFVGQYGTWEKSQDYFRLDGQTPPELRTAYCNSFNRTSNLRARLFLISTKAGGLGINLTAANRVIIFDASWNPSYDVQSIFRIYRFGQNKPCYIYRFLAQGTMEEKIYERQVTKLSISCRVVDEQQIDRHFNNADIVALYEFNRKMPSEDEIPKLPKDRLMAEILKEHKNVIVGYHEHDSLLENQVEEELTEEERKQAWEDYENEKKGVPNMQFLQQQQQLNLLNQMHVGAHPSISNEIPFNNAEIMDVLKKQHPDKDESQLQIMQIMVLEELKKYYTEIANKPTIMNNLKKMHPNASDSELQMMYYMVVEEVKKHDFEQMRLQVRQIGNAQKQTAQNQFMQNPRTQIIDQQTSQYFQQANSPNQKSVTDMQLQRRQKFMNQLNIGEQLKKTTVTSNKSKLMEELKKEHPHASDSQLQTMCTMKVKKLKKLYIEPKLRWEHWRTLLRMKERKNGISAIPQAEQFNFRNEVDEIKNKMSLEKKAFKEAYLILKKYRLAREASEEVKLLLKGKEK